MVSIETISIVFTGLSISLAAFYYINSLRNAQENQRLQLETRQAQLYMNTWQLIFQKRVQDSTMLAISLEYNNYDDFIAKYGKDANPEAYDLLTVHENYMEGLGVLVREKLVSIRLVTLFSSGSIRMGWEKLKPYIMESRKRLNWPRYGIEYEYLYNAMIEYAEQHPELQILPHQITT